MSKRAVAAAFAALAALALAPPAQAHGLGGVRDLPVPLWLFYYGGAIVLVLSFVALGALWRRPLLAPRAAGRPLPLWLESAVLSTAVRVLFGALSIGLLGLAFAAGLLGDQSPLANLAPTFIYVVFWLGLVPVVVLFGNVWSVLNPWRAVADACVWVGERLGVRPEPLLDYPRRLGRWPAAVLLFLWAALELAYFEPANPRVLAIATLFYSYITWAGMAAYGRYAWLENGEAFNVYFGLLARLSPFAVRDRGDGYEEAVVRPPAAALSRRATRPGTIAFIAVMLGSVTFDGFSRTSFWSNRLFDLTAPLVSGSTLDADLARTSLNAAALLAAVFLVAVAYLVAVGVAHRFAPGRPLREEFILSLVPIALAYAVAHYFSLLVLQGQYVIPLMSDPFGFGWDLFGTADYRPRFTLLSPNTTWYVQVGALVTGHVLGLAIAHDRAVTLFRSGRTALRTQYALLVLMVLYTVSGLWLLSQG